MGSSSSSAGGSSIVRLCPSTRTISSAPRRLSEMSPLSAKGSSRRSVAPSARSSRRSETERWCSAWAGGRLAGEERVAEAVEHRRADDLLLEVRGLQHGHGGERVAHGGQLLLLALAPRAEVVADLGAEDAVDHDRVGQVPVQVEVGERAPRLVDDHPIRGHHQPHRDVLVVAQDLVHGNQVANETLDVVEDLGARQRDVEHGAREGAGGVEDPALLGKDLVQPPARDVGKRQQPQRLAGRRAVDDHRVVVAGLVVALDRQQAEQLVHPGRDGQLLGADAVDATGDQQVAEPVLHAGPVALHLLLGADLLAPEQVADRDGLGAERLAQDVRQAVRRIGAEHHRAQARCGAAARGGRGDRRLADAALARVEDRARGSQGPEA